MYFFQKKKKKSNNLVSILQPKCEDKQLLMGILGQKSILRLVIKRSTLTFKRVYLRTVSFLSLQMSKHNHYHHHHHLTFLLSGNSSQDQHSAILENVHTDKERHSFL